MWKYIYIYDWDWFCEQEPASWELINIVIY